MSQSIGSEVRSVVHVLIHKKRSSEAQASPSDPVTLSHSLSLCQPAAVPHSGLRAKGRKGLQLPGSSLKEVGMYARLSGKRTGSTRRWRSSTIPAFPSRAISLLLACCACTSRRAGQSPQPASQAVSHSFAGLRSVRRNTGCLCLGGSAGRRESDRERERETEREREGRQLGRHTEGAPSRLFADVR